MAKNGLASSRPRETLTRLLPRLYKFALVLSANEELARALLRRTCKALIAKAESHEDERERLMGAFRRMYALWSAKVAEDPDIQIKSPPEPRLFAGGPVKGPLSGSAHFAKFIANLPSPQRGVLYLVYGEGASYEEAVEVTALNMLALMKVLARGHLSLSHWLDHRGLAEEGKRREASGSDPRFERERVACHI